MKTDFWVMQGDCRELARNGAENSVDAIICDPPYEIAFMNKPWDQRGVAFDPATWREMYRVLKPGGHVVAFGATRTYHRLATAIEDAGFEIRDGFAWLQAQGMPKGRNISKAIDKEAGAERRVISEGKPLKRMIPGADQVRTGSWIKDNGREYVPTETEPATEDAARWEGWNTALKPAWEPIVLGRKPIEKGLTIAGNVLKHGTGAINVAATAIGTEPLVNERATTIYSNKNPREDQPASETRGRWPANVIQSHADGCRLKGMKEVTGAAGYPGARGPSGYEGGLQGQATLVERRPKTEIVEHWDCVPGCPIAELDRQSGTSKSTARTGRRSGKKKDRLGEFVGQAQATMGHDDQGGASRFFFTAKASAKERNRGLDGWDKKEVHRYGSGIGEGNDPQAPALDENEHPTVKPVSIMRWLIRMIAPPGAIILDPFTGSGSTGIAVAVENSLIPIDPASQVAVFEPYTFIGFELNAEYARIAEARIRHAIANPEEWIY